MKIKGIFIKFFIGLICLISYLGGGDGLIFHESKKNNSYIGIQNKISTEKIFHNYFINKGFTNGEIEIPELNVKITLKENQFVKKEENVMDVCERIKVIRNHFGLPDQNSECIQGYGWCGFLKAECLGKTAYGYIILIKKDLNEVSRVYTVGHESGHFLWYVNEQELIYQKFKKPNLVKSQVHSDCDFAVLCGWAAVKMAGYNLDDCLIINIHNPEKEKSSDDLKNFVKNHLMEEGKRDKNNAEEGTRTPTS
ncbi:MAG: hypothetical protein R6V00_13300 [Candidatus Aminicenantes bacterium]